MPTTKTFRTEFFVWANDKWEPVSKRAYDDCPRLPRRTVKTETTEPTTPSEWRVTFRLVNRKGSTRDTTITVPAACESEAQRCGRKIATALAQCSIGEWSWSQLPSGWVEVMRVEPEPALKAERTVPFPEEPTGYGSIIRVSSPGPDRIYRRGSGHSWQLLGAANASHVTWGTLFWQGADIEVLYSGEVK